MSKWQWKIRQREKWETFWRHSGNNWNILNNICNCWRIILVAEWSGTVEIYFAITNIIIIMSIVQGCISWSIYLLFRYPARLLQSVRRHLRMYCNEGSRHATIQVSSSVHTCAFSPANYRCHWQVLIVTAVHSLPNTSTFLSFSLQLHISFLTVKLSTVNQIFFVVSCHHDICL